MTAEQKAIVQAHSCLVDNSISPEEEARILKETVERLTILLAQTEESKKESIRQKIAILQAKN